LFQEKNIVLLTFLQPREDDFLFPRFQGTAAALRVSVHAVADPLQRL